MLTQAIERVKEFHGSIHVEEIKMPFHHRVLTILIFTGACALSTPARAADKPRVLILGDSISIGYTPFVKQMLKDEVVVIRPKGNCAGTNKGVKNIDTWLKLDGGKWDVIHFNFGLHDLKHVQPKTGRNSSNPKHPRQAEPELYAKQLREIVGKLKKTGAALIFATTTPVPAGGVKPYRDVKDPQRYNEVARKIMKADGVTVNDLYAFANPRLKQIQRPVNVHFTKAGSKLLAGEAVKHIRAALKKRGKSTRDAEPQ